MIDHILEALNDEADSFEVLDYFEFSNDIEAHNDEIQESKKIEFEELLSQNEKLVSASFTLRSSEKLDLNFPISGVWKSFVWHINGKSRYLAIAHEDRECPILFIAGVL